MLSALLTNLTAATLLGLGSPLSCLIETVETDIITQIGDGPCEMTRGSYGNPSGQINVWWRCEGAMGWRGVWHDYGTGEGFGFQFENGPASGLLALSPEGRDGFLGREIKWLLRDARPYAALMTFTEPETNITRLYTIALQETGDPSACVIASFEENGDPNIEDAARLAATLLAHRWTCGESQPHHFTAESAEETPYYTAIQYAAGSARRPEN